jgi:hypothetical protein
MAIDKSVFELAKNAPESFLTHLTDEIPLLPGEDVYLANLIPLLLTTNAELLARQRKQVDLLSKVKVKRYKGYALRTLFIPADSEASILMKCHPFRPYQKKVSEGVREVSFKSTLVTEGADPLVIIKEEWRAAWKAIWEQLAPHLPDAWWDALASWYEETARQETPVEGLTFTYTPKVTASPRPKEGDIQKIALLRAFDPLKNTSVEDVTRVDVSQYAKVNCKFCHGQGVITFSLPPNPKAPVPKRKPGEKPTRIKIQDFCDCVRGTYLKKHGVDVRLVGHL